MSGIPGGRAIHRAGQEHRTAHSAAGDPGRVGGWRTPFAVHLVAVPIATLLVVLVPERHRLTRTGARRLPPLPTLLAWTAGSLDIEQRGRGRAGGSAAPRSDRSPRR